MVAGQCGASEAVFGAATTDIVEILKLTFTACIAFGTATATLVSQSLGAKRPDEAEKFGWASVRLGLVVFGPLAVFLPLWSALALGVVAAVAGGLALTRISALKARCEKLSGEVDLLAGDGAGRLAFGSFVAGKIVGGLLRLGGCGDKLGARLGGGVCFGTLGAGAAASRGAATPHGCAGTPCVGTCPSKGFGGPSTAPLRAGGYPCEGRRVPPVKAGGYPL